MSIQIEPGVAITRLAVAGDADFIVAVLIDGGTATLRELLRAVAGEPADTHAAAGSPARAAVRRSTAEAKNPRPSAGGRPRALCPY
jgi:hypothetical protein